MAGPAEQEGQPVGTVFVTAAVGRDQQTQEFRLDGGPGDVRRHAVDAGASMLVGLLTSPAVGR